MATTADTYFRKMRNEKGEEKGEKYGTEWTKEKKGNTNI
jgi:hypothetical protein